MMETKEQFEVAEADLRVALKNIEQDPGNADHQRDVAISHDKVGDILEAQEDLGAALDHFLQSLEIFQRLAVQDTRNADHQRDVAISHDKVGNVLRIQGDLGAALEHFQQYQEIFQRLVKQDPSNFAWHQDLYISHIRIGEVLELEANIQPVMVVVVELSVGIIPVLFWIM